MKRATAELWSEAIGAPGTVIRYGHWGRPALVFPSSRGHAADFEVPVACQMAAQPVRNLT